MKNFVIHSLTNLFLFFIPTIVIYLFSNSFIYAILFYTVCLIVWIFLHLFEISNLINWLRKPRSSNVPRGIGIWQDIFLVLGKQAKSREKRKNKINIILQRFYKIISAIPNGVILLNGERIEWMNSLAEKHFNLSMTENLDGNLVNLIRNTNFSNLINSDSNNHFKLKVPMLSGSEQVDNRVLLIQSTRIPDNRRLIVSQDITVLENLNKSYNDFIINMSKELKLPLNILDGVSEFLNDHNEITKETFESFVNLVKREKTRMELLINDLTILSNIEKGFDYEYVEIVNLSNLCNKIVGDIKSLALNNYDVIDSIEDNIFTNGIEEYIYYGLKDVAINALKYTKKGGKIEIILKMVNDEKNNKILYQVKDNGIGIAQEHIPFIADRFYRVDLNRLKFSNYIGTGLGVTIAKKVVENLGGSFNIESKLGEGSVFSIYLIPYEKD